MICSLSNLDIGIPLWMVLVPLLDENEGKILCSSAMQVTGRKLKGRIKRPNALYLVNRGPPFSNQP